MVDEREKQIESLEKKLKGNPDFDQDKILERLQGKVAPHLAEIKGQVKTVAAEKPVVKKEVPPPPDLPVEPPKVEENKPKPGEPEERAVENLPSYQPKFLTPDFLRAEGNTVEIKTAFTKEKQEMDAKKVDAQTRIDFWRYLLSVLKKDEAGYDFKKILAEDSLEHAEQDLPLEKGREEAEKSGEDIGEELEKRERAARPPYQAKFVTRGFLHAEDNILKISTAFANEALELEAGKTDAQTRIDFWQDSLNILKKWDAEYKHKKNLIEEQIEMAKSALAMEGLNKGLEKGREAAEALLGPKYEAKFLTLKRFREEKDTDKFLEALRFEDGELDAENIDWDQRIEFWQRILSVLEPADPLHGLKEAAVKARLKRVENKKDFEESLARGTAEFIEQAEEAKEAKFASRVLDIMGAEGVSEEEARRRAEQEIKDEEVREGGEKEKLEKLREARERLAAAEKNKKAYEGLVGRFKGWIKKDEKSGAEAEFIMAEEEYKKARAEYVAGNAERMLKERADLADARARELHEKRGKIYRAWKWLGEQNVEKIMPEKWKAKLAAWRPEGKIGKITKFATRLGTKFLSLRTGVSFGLLGVGIWGGVGTAAAFSLFAARRAIGGAGAGFGTYDLLRRGQESWATTKWNLSWKPWEMKAGLTKEDVEKLSEEELEERMAHFEMNAALGNSKVSENEIYKLLAERYRETVEGKAEMKGADAMKFLEAQMEGVDDKLKELKVKAKRNDRIMKGVAVGMGLVAGSGLISKLIHGKWGWEQFTEERAEKMELRQQLGQAPGVPAEVPHEVLPTVPVEAAAPPEFSAEEVAGRLGLPKESLAQLAGPDGKLTVEQVSEIETQVKGVAQVVDQAPIPEEAKQAVMGAAAENNFEGGSEMARILEKVDPDHLKEAGILKPDGTYDVERLREITNAHTLTIDKKGEGIYKTLRDYYSAPPERGGLGLSGRELRAKIVEQMKNLAFFKGGKLQDLVELGDQIKVDSKGNVLLFVAEDGRMGRTRDILDLVSERAFRSGNRVFEVAPDVHLREALHPIDGHAVIKLTDAAGNTHTISDWSVGRTARIDGHKEVLEDWLKRNNLLADARGATPAVPDEELGGASQARHEILLDEPRRLRDGYQSLTEAHEAHHEAAARAAEEQIGALQESTGINPETARATGEAVASSLEAQIMEHATAYNNNLPLYGIDVKVEDIASMGPEELQNLDTGIGETLEGMAPEAGLSDNALRFREALEDLRDYVNGKLESGGGGVASSAAEEAAASVSEVLHSSQPAQFGDVHITFDYDVFDNPSGIRIGGTPNSFRAESLLNGDWAAKVEAVSPGGLDDARLDVMSTARELEIRARLLEGLERSGLGQSPEAEFLRKSTKMIIENTEEQYGDVFRE
jgi:hypothetical protein